MPASIPSTVLASKMQTALSLGLQTALGLEFQVALGQELQLATWRPARRRNGTFRSRGLRVGRGNVSQCTSRAARPETAKMRRETAKMRRETAKMVNTLPRSATSGATWLELDGERVALLPDRAVWWPATATLFVADVHLGKAATYRAHGVPVPESTTASTLAALSTLLGDLDVRRVIWLGDLLHAREAQQPVVLDAVFAWRCRHAAVDEVTNESRASRTLIPRQPKRDARWQMHGYLSLMLNRRHQL